MQTYYLREVYSATGEGVTSFIAVGQAENKEDFVDLCDRRGIDSYFLIQPLVFLKIEDIPDEEIEMIKNNYPTLYKRLEKRQYEVGSFWWSTIEHLNMS